MLNKLEKEVSSNRMDVVEAHQRFNNEVNQITQQLGEAVLDGVLTADQSEVYREVLLRNIQASGLSLSLCKMSNMTKMEVKLKEGVKPFRAADRTMGTVQKEAMRAKINDLKQMGMLVRDPNPFFSSPAMMVPKPNAPGQFRMLVDLRRVNESVEVNAGSLPNIEMQTQWLPPGCTWFAAFDALSGFDMLKTSDDASKYFAISTPFGCYRLLASPQGFVNTPFLYQERMINEVLGGTTEGSLFGTAPGGVLQWLDDSLCYAQSFEEFRCH